MKPGQWVYVAPSIYGDITRPPTPKQKWKRAHHVARWERRYGRPKEVFTGYIGTLNGFQIHRSTP